MRESSSLIHFTGLLQAIVFVLLYLIWTELRQARKTRGQTAEEAAEVLSVDVRTYLGWERGEHQPRPLNRLAVQRTYLEAAPIEFTLTDLDTLLRHFGVEFDPKTGKPILPKGPIGVNIKGRQAQLLSSSIVS